MIFLFLPLCPEGFKFKNLPVNLINKCLQQVDSDIIYGELK